MPITETQEEPRAWQPTIRAHALSWNVLAVATTRIEGTWKAYCGAVPGQNHDHEWQEVMDQGCQLPEGIARAIFPCLADIPYVG